MYWFKYFVTRKGEAACMRDGNEAFYTSTLHIATENVVKENTIIFIFKLIFFTLLGICRSEKGHALVSTE